MDVLLGQSYYLRFDPKLWEAQQPYPPLGTLYAASWLRSRGYETGLFDAMLARSEAEWEQALAAHRPPVAVLYEDNFNYLSKMCLLRMRQAAFTMLAMARRSGCLAIAAGADASDHPELYLDQGADFVILGEGELTLGELVDTLSGRSSPPLDEIPGLAFLAGAQKTMVRTPPRPNLRDLDCLPFPAWDLVDIERYRRIWLQKHGYFSLNLATTRGCPFHCNWCAKPIWGQRYSTRSPENVAAELKWLKESYSPDHLWIVDDIFGLKPGWVQRFAELVEENEARTPFKSLNRADLLLRPGEIEALKRAGCDTVWLGAESGSQDILDAMDKGTHVEQIYTAARRLREAGIRTGFFLQFGYPGETLADIQRTLRMVAECDPDDIGISVSYPLPGTPFHEMVRAQLGAQQNWVNSSDLAMLYQGPYSTAFYRQLHQVAHLEFRRRGSRRALRQSAAPGGARFRRKQPRWLALARWSLDTARLPLARLRLKRLARTPHQGIGPLPRRMHPAEAAQPTRQDLQG
jgi:radical SAM superfamily enzyme YgiQ (UPF0313 family)